MSALIQCREHGDALVLWEGRGILTEPCFACELRQRLYDLEFALKEAKTGLEGCSDIDHHGNPNWAMYLLQIMERQN